MSNKTFRVARREYLENVRTKGFWIGVFVVPLIMLALVRVPQWLESRHEVRQFAVVDRSGWLDDAVKRRRAMPDLEKLFGAALKRFREGDPKLSELPKGMQTLAAELDTQLRSPAVQKALEQAGDEQRVTVAAAEEKLVAGLAMATQLSAEQIESLPVPGFLKEPLRRGTQELVAFRDEINTWYRGLSPEQAREWSPQLSKSRFEQVAVDPNEPGLIETLNQRVADRDLFAYFVIDEDPVSTGFGGAYVANNLTDRELLDEYSRLAEQEVRERRLAEKKIDLATAKWIQAPLDFDSKKIGADGKVEEVKKQDMLRQWAPIGFAYLLWISVFTISQMLLTNTIEEKSSRVIEVLLSSVSPLQLMAGKIIGIAATGITMIVIWAACMLGLVEYMSTGNTLNLREIFTDPVYLGSFFVYFVLGYLFYAALLVAIGAACDTLKEAQNLMGPISVILMIPLLAMVFMVKDPNSRLAVVMSYIPPFTPFVMMNRAAGPPTTFEYVTTTLLLLVFIAIALWGAAKVFRVGVLMTGRGARFSDILLWVRTPVGQVPERKNTVAVDPAGADAATHDRDLDGKPR